MKRIVVGDCVLNKEDGRTWVFESGEGQTSILNLDYRRISIGNGYLESIPTLHIPISEPWFSRILSGEKTEEYRETSVFNRQRLCVSSVWHELNEDGHFYNKTPFPNTHMVLSVDEYKPLKILHLTNGYGHHRPQLWAHIKEITIGKGKPEWGAPEHDVFVIKFGEVFHTKNLKIVN